MTEYEVDIKKLEKSKRWLEIVVVAGFVLYFTSIAAVFYAFWTKSVLMMLVGITYSLLSVALLVIGSVGSSNKSILIELKKKTEEKT